MQIIYSMLGSILPVKVLKRWSKLSMNTIRWNIADNAPAKRGVM